MQIFRAQPGTLQVNHRRLDKNEDGCDINEDNECAMLERVLTITECDSSTDVEELFVTKAIPLENGLSMRLFYHGKAPINLVDQFFPYVVRVMWASHE